jgi:hypothetical protein
MEALAYDTMKLALSILEDPEIATRNGFARALWRPKNFRAPRAIFFRGQPCGAERSSDFESSGRGNCAGQVRRGWWMVAGNGLATRRVVATFLTGHGHG